MIKKIFYLLSLISCFSLPQVHALEIMLPLVYEEGLQLSDWLMSEKLDGVRAYWDGKRLLFQMIEISCRFVMAKQSCGVLLKMNS